MEPSPADFFDLPILDNFPITRNCWMLRLESLEVSRHARPGQFLLIRVGLGPDNLLLRPFSFCQIHPEENLVSIVYKLSGPGTTWLATRKKGETLSVFGPLGNPFTVPKSARHIALVGGGIGVTPLVSLGEALQKEKKKISFFLGLRTQADMTITPELLEFASMENRHFSTDDGTLGEKGHIVDFLKAFLEKNQVDYIAACGPRPMLEALKPLAASHRIPTEVAVERAVVSLEELSLDPP